MPEVRTTSSTGGDKGVKLARFGLIPIGPLTELAEHYGIGASKYANHQWRQGYEWSKSYDALMRHLTAFWAGQDFDVCSNDPEGCSHVDLEGNPFVAVREDACFNHTGSHHMAAVAWHAFLLLEFKDAHQQHDDRYVAPADQPSSTVCGHTVGPIPKLGGEVIACELEPHGRDVSHEGAGAIWDDEPRKPVTDHARAVASITPEEPVHRTEGWVVGERAADLVEAEQPPLDLTLVEAGFPAIWVRGYDAEYAAQTYGFPRLHVAGLPTLAEATEGFGPFDLVDISGFQKVVQDEILRITRAADRRVEDRLREQFGPDLLRKRAPRVGVDYDDGHTWGRG